MTRVVITGVGVVSCYGRGLSPLVDAMRDGKSGIRALQEIDLSRLRCHVGAQIPSGVVDGGPADRFTRIALMAADDAMAQAETAGTIDPHRFGVIIGTALGGCETLDNAYLRFYGQTLRVSPVTIPSAMYNAATSAVAIAHQAMGPGYAVVSACASANHAIGLAAQTIAAGQADAMLTGGSDAPLTPGIITAWESMRVLACDAEHPALNARPFDANRKGLVLAEGAAVFVLERYEHAVARGAAVLGEIVGFGLSTDAGHMTDPSAQGAQRAIAMAVPAGERPDYINAHGTGTRANDAIETEAIRRVFGDDARRIPISSTKSMHGHAMGASGGIELAATLGSLAAGFLPPTINLETPDPACDLDYVANTARPARVRMFLSNSFAFGGLNAVLAVRVPDRPED